MPFRSARATGLDLLFDYSETCGMKRFLLTILLGSATLPVISQQLQFNAPDPLPRGSYGDIHSSPGTLGDRYYLLYNQMKRRAKGAEDPGDAYLKIYSVSRGTLLGTVNLDSIAKRAHPQEAVLFSEFFIWRGEFLGVYAGWKPSGTWVNLYTQRFDDGGSPLGRPLLLATARPRAAAEGGDGKVASLEAISILQLTTEIRHAFNEDSSRLAVYNTGTGWTGIPVVTLSPSATSVTKQFVGVPGGSRLVRAVPEGADSLFVLIAAHPAEPGRQPSFTLLSYNGKTALPESIHIALPGKNIQDATFRVESDAHLVVTGTYAPWGDKTADKATSGVFALNITPAGEQVHSDLQPFPPAMISDLDGYRASRKDRGLKGVVRLSGLVAMPGAGMVSIGTSAYQRCEVTATPMVLEPHYDAGGNFVLTKVSPSGDIRWLSYLKRFYENYPSTAAPVPFYATHDGGELVVVYDENGEERTHQQVFVDRYDDRGMVDRDWMALPRSLNTRSTWIMWNTATLMGGDQIMVAYYNTWKKELGTLKIGLSREMRLSSNP
jgi:hypothetical protein